MDKINILEDIQTEFMKLYNECKKKYTSIKDAIDETLSKITDSKSISGDEGKKLVDFMLKPIILVTEAKHNKLYVSCLSIVKKLVTYNLIKQNQTNTVIKILKEVLDNSSEEYVQIKVIETLLPMVNPQVIKLTDDLVINVLTMCLKIYSLKNSTFKNPVAALFKQLMITVFGFLDSFLKPNIIKKISIIKDKMIKEIEDNEDRRKKEKISEENHKSDEHKEDNINNNNDNNDNTEKNEVNEDNKNENKESNEIDVVEKEIILENNNADNIDDKNKNNENIENKGIDKIKESIYLSVDLKELDLSEFYNVEVYITSLSTFKVLIQLLEGKRKELIYPSIYSKSLVMELLAGIIDQAGFTLSYLEEFTAIIENDVIKILTKSFETTNDYITGMKLCRLAVQIITKLNMGFNLIPYILKYAESNQIWQKYLGMESLSVIFQSPEVIKHLYTMFYTNNNTIKSEIQENKDSSIKVAKNNNTDKNSPKIINYYDDIIKTIINLSYTSITSKNDPKLMNNKTIVKGGLSNINYISPPQKIILTSTILTETDAYININTVYPNSNIVHKFLFESYSNLRDSFIKILDEFDLSSNKKNRIDNGKKESCVDLLLKHHEEIKNAMTVLFLDTYDETHCQGYLNIFLNYITIYGSLNCNSSRDSFLNDLCKLAIPNNLENSLELKDKNLLIAKTLFNIAHCTSIMDCGSWKLLIDTFQKIYLMLINSNNHMLKPSQEFEIDVIIRNLESTIKKYDPEYGNNQERTVLKADMDEGGSSGSNRGNENKKQLNRFDPSPISKLETEEYNSGNAKKIETKENKEENIDLLIISTALDSLFINSKNYDSVLIYNIGKAFYLSTKNIIETNSSINDNIITYLHFNLTKLLELSVINLNKIPYIWDFIVGTITLISSKNFTNISRFAMDCLSILDMFLLTQFKIKDFIKLYHEEVSLRKEREERNHIDKIEEESRQIIFDVINQQQIDYLEGFCTDWQDIIFKPYISIIESISHMNIFLNIVYNMGKVLQNCGNNFDVHGWENFFKILGLLVMKADDNLVEQTFKLVSTVDYEFSNFLMIENTQSFNSLLETFTLNKKNSNTSYKAISMFWTSAKLIEKYSKTYKKLVEVDADIDSNTGKLNLLAIKDKKSEFYNDFNSLSAFQKEIFEKEEMKKIEIRIDEEWEPLFGKMHSLCLENRSEVRKAAITTFADIFVNTCSLMNENTSSFILQYTFFKLINKAFGIFESKIKKNRSKIPVVNSNNTESQSTENFENDNIHIGDYKADSLKMPGKDTSQKNTKVHRISSSPEEKEWEETCVLLAQAIGKSMRTLFIYFKKNDINNTKIYDSLFLGIISNYSQIMKMTTPELASALIKSIHEIFIANNVLFYQYTSKIWSIFDEMGRFITSEFFLTQLCNLSSGSKMIYHILDILKDIYVKHQSIYNVFQDNKSLEKLLQFCSMLLKSSRSTEGLMHLHNPQKHLIEERNVFDFLEQLHYQVKTQTACNTYHHYLLKFLKYDLSDAHTEAHCRRVLEILEIFYNGKMNNKNVSTKDLILDLIKDASYLCCLRNKNEYVTVLIKNNKQPLQLWHFTVYQLIKILRVILCNKPSIKPQLKNNNNDMKENTENKIEIEEEENNEEIRSTDKNEVWEATINCFENIFKQSEGGYKNITRTLLDELLKSCQEMEVEVINFIVNDLLPHSLKIPKEKQIKLLNLLDLGCNFDYSTLNYNSQHASSISKVCISNLFELCQYKSEEKLRSEIEEDKDEYVRIKVKIAKMSTPILLRRCKEIFKTFFDEEQKQGSMPLSRSRIDDMKYMLDSLKSLELYPNYHLIDEEVVNKNAEDVTINDTIMKSKKSHLFSLMPYFSEFITGKEIEIKLIVKDIFRLITVQIEK